VFYFEQYGKRDNETKDEETTRISRDWQQDRVSMLFALDQLWRRTSFQTLRLLHECYSFQIIFHNPHNTRLGFFLCKFWDESKSCLYKSLINNVVRTFRPKRFVMTLMADELGLHEMRENPLTESASGLRIVVPAVGKKQMTYKRSSLASYQGRRWLLLYDG
jgi:hypothetical protein